MDLPDLIAKYDQRVPRYTSYPTAPHFSAARGRANLYQLAARIAGGHRAVTLSARAVLRPALPVLRLPYRGGAPPEPVIAYARTLLAEIDLLAETIGRRLAVRHIALGRRHTDRAARGMDGGDHQPVAANGFICKRIPRSR